MITPLQSSISVANRFPNSHATNPIDFQQIRRFHPLGNRPWHIGPRRYAVGLITTVVQGMRIALSAVVVTFLAALCDREERGVVAMEPTVAAVTADNSNATKAHMNRLEHVMGTLLETWDQRYTFVHDREEPSIIFEVPGFTLRAVVDGEEDVALLFEEAGTKHRVVCKVGEAPRVIEALLFPEAVPE